MCPYCGQSTFLAPTAAAPNPYAGPAANPYDDPAPERLDVVPSTHHQRLLAGPAGVTEGSAFRRGPSAEAGRDVAPAGWGMWPSGATASPEKRG